MARVTVEDCILKVPNRFELVLLATRRARDISAGAPLTVERDNDKNPVVALREIAEGTVEIETLRNQVAHGLRRDVEVDDEPDEDISALLAAEQVWAGVTQEPVPESRAEEGSGGGGKPQAEAVEGAADEAVKDAPATESPPEVDLDKVFGSKPKKE